MKKLLIIAFSFICFTSLNAAIINVPSEQPTIQAGIDIALPGDTILVEPGVYTGDGNRDLDCKGKKIRFGMSELGPLGVFLNCEGTEAEPHRGFWFHSGEDSTTVVDGFTIFNAYAPEWDNAAVLIEGASPKFVNCVIENNVGNGVRVNQGELFMYDCAVRNNVGFGVRVDESPAVISGCEIASNIFDGVFWQAQWYGHEFDMSYCLAGGNGGYGLNLMVGSGYFHVYNCTFVGNTTGLVYDWDFPKIAVTEGTTNIDFCRIENNIMAFNAEYGIVSHVWAGDVEVTCNNAFGNVIADYYEIGFGPGDGFGNISEDPMFCDPAAYDYTLYEQSPCLPANNECGVLMGAFGLGCTCCVVRGDFNHDGVLDPFDVFNPDPLVPSFIGWFYLGGAGPVCMEESDVNGDGAANPLDLVYIVNYLWRFGPPPVSCE